MPRKRRRPPTKYDRDPTLVPNTGGVRITSRTPVEECIRWANHPPGNADGLENTTAWAVILAHGRIDEINCPYVRRGLRGYA